MRRRLRRMAQALSARLGRLGVVVRGWAGSRLHANRRVRVQIASRDRPAILTLPLEEYVAGTATAETGPAWAAEALEAQAVVSRTYALHRLLHPRGLRHHVTGSTQNQVFRPGVPVPSAVAAAVDATRAVYLAGPVAGARDDLAPINALFHTSCGGGTDTAAGVWGEGAAERGQPCAACARAPVTWTATVEIAELCAALGWRVAPVGALRILAVARTPSARLRLVRIETGARGRTLSAEAFRALLGYHRIRSARFEWSVEPDGRIRFIGVGAGHGVGLCHTGARELGAAGRRYPEILAHYYPGSRLARLPGPV